MNNDQILEKAMRLTDYGLDFNDIRYVKRMPLTMQGWSQRPAEHNPQVGDIVTTKNLHYAYESRYIIINRQLPVSNYQWNFATPIIRCTDLKLNPHDRQMFLNYMKKHNYKLHSLLSPQYLAQKHNEAEPWNEAF